MKVQQIYVWDEGEGFIQKQVFVVKMQAWYIYMVDHVDQGMVRATAFVLAKAPYTKQRIWFINRMRCTIAHLHDKTVSILHDDAMYSEEVTMK